MDNSQEIEMLVARGKANPDPVAYSHCEGDDESWHATTHYVLADMVTRFGTTDIHDLKEEAMHLYPGYGHYGGAGRSFAAEPFVSSCDDLITITQSGGLDI